MVVADSTAGFDRLRSRYPWPEHAPYDDVEATGRKPRGFELLANALRDLDKPEPVVMEIGAEFGGSTRRFLGLPGTRVVSVDPWPDEYSYRGFDALQERFRGQPDAMFNIFLSVNFEHRERLVAVRDFSPAGPVKVHDAGVDVDLVYIDGDHKYDAVVRDLDVSAALFPAALLSGDDWLFQAGARKYEGLEHPVQLAVKRWAQVHDVAVRTSANTWLIDPSCRYDLERVGPVIAASADAPTAPAAEPAPGALRRAIDALTRRTT